MQSNPFPNGKVQYTSLSIAIFDLCPIEEWHSNHIKLYNDVELNCEAFSRSIVILAILVLVFGTEQSS